MPQRSFYSPLRHTLIGVNFYILFCHMLHTVYDSISFFHVFYSISKMCLSRIHPFQIIVSSNTQPAIQTLTIKQGTVYISSFFTQSQFLQSNSERFPLNPLLQISFRPTTLRILSREHEDYLRWNQSRCYGKYRME